MVDHQGGVRLNVTAEPLPANALLARYRHDGSHTDCYVADVPGTFTHADYVEAFYTTRVFKLERLILAWLVSKASTDAQARQLAAGEIDSFAAWDVEARDVDQILMCDFQRRTRSWLMVTTVEGSPAATRLYFGSAVVASKGAVHGPATHGLAFRALLGFHKIYSRVLLRAARRRLVMSRPRQQVRRG